MSSRLVQHLLSRVEELTQLNASLKQQLLSTQHTTEDDEGVPSTSDTSASVSISRKYFLRSPERAILRFFSLICSTTLSDKQALEQTVREIKDLFIQREFLLIFTKPKLYDCYLARWVPPSKQLMKLFSTTHVSCISSSCDLPTSVFHP